MLGGGHGCSPAGAEVTASPPAPSLWEWHRWGRSRTIGRSLGPPRMGKTGGGIEQKKDFVGEGLEVL